MNNEIRIENWLEQTAALCHTLATKSPDYPDFYVFQSKVRLSPELLIIGANPHGNTPYRKKLEEKGISRRTGADLISGENMFVSNPEWHISRPILKLFERNDLSQVLEDAVIMNAIYFNTDKVAQLQKFPHGKEMIELCRSLTTELVYEILNPRVILFLGNDAPKWMNIQFEHSTDTVLQSEDGLSLVQQVVINGIPHYKIHHPSMNFRFNTGENLQRKKAFFEESIFEMSCASK